MRYSYGDPRNPCDDDPRFASFEEAQQEAAKQSRIEDRIFAVWEDESGEILALVYDGIAYRSC